MPALALMGVWAGAGYNMVLFLAGLTEIPQHLYDAARVDGANAWQQFWHVTLPMLRNTLVFVLVMTIIGAFQVFTSVYIMTSGGPERSTEVIAYTIFLWPLVVLSDQHYYPLTVGLSLFRAETGADWPRIFAASTMGAAPLILLFLAAQRYLVGGISLSGMKV